MISRNTSKQTVFMKSVMWKKKSKRGTEHTKYKSRNKHINLFPLDFKAEMLEEMIIMKTITCYWFVCF